MSGETLLKRDDSGCKLLLPSCDATLYCALLRFKVNKNWKFAERNELARSWKHLIRNFHVAGNKKQKSAESKLLLRGLIT